MLEDADANELGEIICWQPGQVSFRVVDPRRFAMELLPLYFNQTKYKSFQRQLNMVNTVAVHHAYSITL